MSIISLTTDFGLKDGFVGVLKGVIWGICPAAQTADITHLIAPQNVLEGAIALWRAAPFFPAGTVHLAVVDPGVGTQRRPLAARLGLANGVHYFVGPDNGLFTPLIEEAERAGREAVFVCLDNPAYWLPNVSHTFHGRDIFAPAAAHLANGVALENLGTPFNNPQRLALPQPEAISGGWRAHITVVDVFGNLTTDLRAGQVAGLGPLRLHILGRQIDRLVDSYGHCAAGELVALVDSEGYIEVAVVNGSAARLLGAQVGDPLEVLGSAI